MSNLRTAITDTLLPFCEAQTDELRKRFKTDDASPKAKRIADVMRANGQAGQAAWWEVMAAANDNKDLAKACQLCQNGGLPVCPPGAVVVVTGDSGGGHSYKVGFVSMSVVAATRTPQPLRADARPGNYAGGSCLNATQGGPSEYRAATPEEVKEYVSSLSMAALQAIMQHLGTTEPWKSAIMGQ